MKEEMHPSAEDRLLEELFCLEREMAEKEPDLPNPAYIRWKAVEAERRAARERALQPIVWMERAAWLAAGAALLVLVAWSWPVTGWDVESIRQALAGFPPASGWILLGVSLIGLLNWLVWAEE